MTITPQVSIGVAVKLGWKDITISAPDRGSMTSRIHGTTPEGERQRLIPDLRDREVTNRIVAKLAFYPRQKWLLQLNMIVQRNPRFISEPLLGLALHSNEQSVEALCLALGLKPETGA